MVDIALLFPGQGSQYIGMGKNIYEKYLSAKRTFEEASDTLKIDMKKLCFDGNINILTKTENAQPALLTVSIAMFRVYMEQIGIMPALCAGNSLGEISALTCAGSIEYLDALKIVRKRGEFMKESVTEGTGAMSAISKVSCETVAEICAKLSENGDIVVVSNYNSMDQTVISGDRLTVSKAEAELKKLGAKIVALNVSAPFHSPFMEIAASKFGMELKKYEFKEPKYPIISNITALPYPDKSAIIDNLSRQLVMPVLWYPTIEYMCKNNINIFIEMGPQTVLRDLNRANKWNIKSFSYDNMYDFQVLYDLINRNQKLNKSNGVYTNSVITKCLAAAVCTKNHNWNMDEYEKGVVQPYKQMQKIQETIEREDVLPNEEQMYIAYKLLSLIFNTKRVPVEEQSMRFESIFKEKQIKDFIQMLPKKEMVNTAEGGAYIGEK